MIMTEAETVASLLPVLNWAPEPHSVYRTFAVLPPQQLGAKCQRCVYIFPPPVLALVPQLVAKTEVQSIRLSVQLDGEKLNLRSRKVLRVSQLMLRVFAYMYRYGATVVEPVKALAVVHIVVLAAK
jgi:hypothetical protein